IWYRLYRCDFHPGWIVRAVVTKRGSPCENGRCGTLGCGLVWLLAWTGGKSERLTGSRNFHEGAAQLDCEPPKQVATVCPVTSFTRPLECCGRGGKLGGADHQRGSVQLVRCCRQRGQAATV